MRHALTSVAASAAVLAVVATVRADVVVVSDKAEWISMAGEITTLDFTGFEAGALVSDQYQGLGVLFADNDDFTIGDPVIFPDDGWGCASLYTELVLEFATPQNWLAAEFPGNLKFRLFSGGKQIFVSTLQGIGGYGNFAGLVSTVPFDAAIIEDFDKLVGVDDIHFGPRLPGDANGDAVVNVQDIIDVIQGWGQCSEEGGLPARRHPRRRRERERPHRGRPELALSFRAAVPTDRQSFMAASGHLRASTRVRPDSGASPMPAPASVLRHRALSPERRTPLSPGQRPGSADRVFDA